MVWNYSRSLLEKQAKINFEADNGAIFNNINTRLNRDVNILYGFKGLFSASKSVERNEFLAYAESLNLAEQYPGVFSLSYVELVGKKELADWTKTIKNDDSIVAGGYPNFKIFPEQDREKYAVVKYVYPEKENASTLGFDCFSDAARKLAMDYATKNYAPAMTSQVTLVANSRPAFIVFLPVYKKNIVNGQLTKDDQSELLGFVTVSLEVERFFNSALSQFLASEIINQAVWDFNVQDVSGVSNTTNHPAFYDLNPNLFESLSQMDNFNNIILFNIAGRNWSYNFIASTDYGLSSLERKLPWMLLVGGAILSWLLLANFFSIFNSRRRAIKIAEQMAINYKESENKFRAISQAAKDAIVVMDENSKVVFWNEAAVKMFGYKSDEIIGKEFHDFITTKTEHRKKENLIHFGKTGESAVLNKSLEMPVKDKVGKIFTVELTVAKTKIDNRWHAVGIMRDVSERKKQDDILRTRTEELERLNKNMVGREIKMRELKAEISKIKATKKVKKI